MEKKCSKCELIKPLSGFHKNKFGKLGHHSQCRVCTSERKKNQPGRGDGMRRYYRDNKEAIAKKKKRYYQDNREDILEKRKSYYTNNKKSTQRNYEGVASKQPLS